MEDFVDFETAKKLKEKGFIGNGDIGCRYGFYTDADNYAYDDLDNSELLPNECLRFTISQALKWLRKEKKIFITINIGYCYESYDKPFPNNPKMDPILKGYYYGVWNLDNLNDENGHSKYFESPEQATLAGIEYVLDNLI